MRMDSTTDTWLLVYVCGLIYHQYWARYLVLIWLCCWFLLSPLLICFSFCSYVTLTAKSSFSLQHYMIAGQVKAYLLRFVLNSFSTRWQSYWFTEKNIEDNVGVMTSGCRRWCREVKKILSLSYCVGCLTKNKCISSTVWNWILVFGKSHWTYLLR